MAYFIGSLVGGLVLTGLITRLFLRKTGKTKRGALKAFGYTAAICLGLGSLGMGPLRAIINYLPALLLWLVFDLVRVQPETQIVITSDPRNTP